MKKRAVHSSVRKGKRVVVLLRDGTRILDRFVERTDRWIVLEKHGRIAKEDLRSLILDRGANTEAPAENRNANS